MPSPSPSPVVTGRLHRDEAAIRLRRADGKTIEVRGTREAAFLRAGEIADEMTADARRREVVHAR